jgi:hypothetical protein
VINRNTRALRGTGRSYTHSTTRALVIDHIVPPPAAATTKKKVPGESTSCSKYGAILPGKGKYTRNTKGQLTTYVTYRLRALIFYSDRKIKELIKKRHFPSDVDVVDTRPVSMIERVQKARLINMVPLEIISRIPIATEEWPYFKERGYKIYGASDGSGEKNDGQSGAFAWTIVAARSPTDIYILHRGWGWECIRARLGIWAALFSGAFWAVTKLGQIETFPFLEPN